MLSLRGRSQLEIIKRKGMGTDISSGWRSSSLSSGWSTGVSISGRSEQVVRKNEIMVALPMSNDCFAMPLEASRPAKFPYIPSGASLTLHLAREGQRRTGTVEIPPVSNVEHDTIDSEQDAAAVLAGEGLESLGGEGLV
jgi:hypothetical protein